MRHRIFFYLEWCVATYDGRIVTDGCLNIFFLSLLACNVLHYPLFFLISVLILLISYFIPFSFIEVYIVFNLVI
jgi:hypothetical protein